MPCMQAFIMYVYCIFLENIVLHEMFPVLICVFLCKYLKKYTTPGPVPLQPNNIILMLHPYYMSILFHMALHYNLQLIQANGYMHAYDHLHGFK